MDIKTLYKQVLKSINIIAKDLKRNKSLFLTEGDLECRLFKELQNNLPNEGITEDKRHKTSYAHSQLRYFEGERLDKNSVDIVVVPPGNFNFKNHNIVRRRDYYCEEPSIPIELKLNKGLNISSALMRVLKADLEKLKMLQRNRKRSKFVSVLFDKNKVFRWSDQH